MSSNREARNIRNRYIRRLFGMILPACLLIPVSVSHADEEHVASACATLEFMAKMTALNLLLPANNDDVAELQLASQQMRELNRLACQPVVHDGGTRYQNTYANGRQVSIDLFNQAWYFPNGQVFTTHPGRNSAIYYPNGQLLAYGWTRGEETVFWPNGNPATFSFRTEQEAWYYPDGHIITYLAGVQGARWFYPFARLDGQVGQEMISSKWGRSGEYFSHLRFSRNGLAFVEQQRIRGKLVLSDAELLDVPGVLLMGTRLYQAPDEAMLFLPGDGSIAGAPY